MEKKRQTFGGFYVPNSTQVPDILFDELLSELSGAELKVVLYIIRRTFGFKRQTDTISLNQMLSGITKKSGEVLDKGTGLSKPALLKALRSLSEQGIILQTRKYDRKGGNMPTEYRLHIAAEPPRERGDETPSKELLPSPLGKKSLLGSEKKFTKGLVKKVTPQGTGIQVTDTVNVNGAASKSENSAGYKTDLRRLRDVEQPRGKTRDVAQNILSELGDTHSQAFYYLVAAKVPENVILKTLSEIKNDGADQPARVFSHRMKLWAEKQFSKQDSTNFRATISQLAMNKRFG